MLDLMLKLVTIGSVVTGAIAVYIALRNNSRQLGAQIFLAYSGRIHEMRQSLGPAVDLYELASQPCTTLAPGLRRIIIDVVHVSFEFYSLQRRGYVAPEIWGIWQTDIARLFRTTAIRSEWVTLEKHFEFHPHFRQWVESITTPVSGVSSQ